MYVVASWSRHGQNWLFIREVPKWWVGWLDWKNEAQKWWVGWLDWKNEAQKWWVGWVGNCVTGWWI